ncbi:B-block binding subunit of TFIIIC, partial [Dillenia turbinata]
MDSIVSSALEEICSQGTNGLSLPLLFSKLSLSSDTFTKQSLWSNLLKIPSLQFQSLSSSLSPHDSSIQSFQGAERLQIKIIAEEQLRDCFVGLYDIKSSDAGISDIQRRTLERLAIARSSGITQSQLCKEFDIKGNNMFYVVKNLECRGLITRQSTTVRTNEASDQKESKVSSIINTNLLHLYRYTKHLGSQQKIEITESDNTVDSNEDVDGGVGTGYGVVGESVKKDFIIKDYVPAMKAVCDKLEEANDKVLVATDIKKDLGYQNYKGHKAWRNICNRLVDARLVEEFDAKVKEKPAPCLRLLRSFDPKEFEPKTHGHGQGDSKIEQLPKFGRRGQITEQVVELPIDNQIFDMIEAAASNGLTVFEVCKRLGINNKRNYSRFMNLFSRFGMHLQAENHNRGVAFRAWTAGNFQPDPDDPIASKSVSFSGGKELSYQEGGELTVPQDSSQVITEFQTSTRDALPLDSVKTKETEAEHSLCSLEVGQHDNELVRPSSLQDAVCEIRDVTPGEELRLGTLSPQSGIAPPKTSKPALLSPSKRCSSYPKNPSISLTALSARREQRILERLQEEKFILKAELHKWLESFEKDKGTTMDRKTLMRCLNKLQQEGRCKSITVGVPVVTNFSHSRTTVVVLHPSVQSLTPELLGQIHDRLRSLNTQVHSQGMPRPKDVQALPVLNGVQRIERCVESDAQAVRSEAMRANGFVLAKMVRAKLLHNFLWSYLSDSSDWDEALASGEHVYDLKNPHSTCKMFALDAAIKAMPLELFLQVVGSPQKFGDMVEKCKNGTRLSDLPLQEYKVLMDTQATGRLSWIIDILRRLKLIRLTTGGCSGDGDTAPCTSFSHALELRPYIEEPLSVVSPSSGVSSLDLRPRIRHDFILSNKVAVDIYWKTLEFCYAAADRTAALHAFPGSAVHEVFLFRSWASVRVMTADQRAELLKRVVKDDSSKKLSFRQCEEIAEDLNLTLEQVLRVYSDKRLRRLDRFCRAQGANEEELRPRNRRRPSSRKRKRSMELLLKRKKGNASGKFDNQTPGEFSDSDVQFTKEPTTLEIFSEEHGTDLQSSNMSGDKLTVDEPEQTEDGEEHYSLASHCAFPRMKPARQRKFSWTEKADRELVIQYARHRASLGAKFHRTDWISLPDLPAPPSTCRRRMAILNSNVAFRKALMRLCSMLSEQYAKHLRGSHYTLPNNENLIEGSSSREALIQVSKVLKHSLGPDSKEEQWDNFDNVTIKIALDEVLRYKKLAKLDASERAGGLSKETDISKVRVGH